MQPKCFLIPLWIKVTSLYFPTRINTTAAPQPHSLSSPPALCSSHRGLLTIGQVGQASSCLRAFALAWMFLHLHLKFLRAPSFAFQLWAQRAPRSDDLPRTFHVNGPKRLCLFLHPAWFYDVALITVWNSTYLSICSFLFFFCTPPPESTLMRRRSAFCLLCYLQRMNLCQ